MPLIDFYEIRDFQDVSGQNLLNVYHVRNLGTGGPAGNVAQAFMDWVLPVMRPLQTLNLGRSFVEVENLGSPFDFATVDSSAFSGTRANQALTTLQAATIQFNRTRTDMKNGMKRLYAGSEVDMLVNFWDALFIAELQGLGDKIVDQWELTATPGVKRVEFVVLKRFCTVLPSPPCTGVYRLPDTDVEIDANFYRPLTATVRDTIRSQVSRKRLV